MGLALICKKNAICINNNVIDVSVNEIKSHLCFLFIICVFALYFFVLRFCVCTYYLHYVFSWCLCIVFVFSILIGVPACLCFVIVICVVYLYIVFVLFVCVCLCFVLVCDLCLQFVFALCL